MFPTYACVKTAALVTPLAFLFIFNSAYSTLSYFEGSVALPPNSPDSSCLVLDWLPGQLVSVPVLTVSGRTAPARTAASDDSHTQEIC